MVAATVIEGTVLCGDQSAANQRLGDYEKTSNPQEGAEHRSARAPREPLIKRNQYIPNERG